MENRLMLCAGIFRRPGWKTLDIKGGDYQAEIPPLPKELYEVGWDAVEWIHGIGSFYPWQGERLLLEIRSILVVGGVLILEQPHFEKTKSRVEWVYGDPTFEDPYHMMKWAYTPDTLGDLLEKTGYHSIQRLPAEYHVPDRDFRMVAYR